jgi:hypothetical protein
MEDREMATEPIVRQGMPVDATMQAGSQAAAIQKSAPLLNRTLVVFLGAMVLANISSHMYEPLLPLISRA